MPAPLSPLLRPSSLRCQRAVISLVPQQLMAFPTMSSRKWRITAEMRTGPTFPEVATVKWRRSEKSRQRSHHRQHDGTSTVGSDQRQGGPKDARADRRCDAEHCKVGIKVIRSVARSPPQAGVGSGRQHRDGHRDQPHQCREAGRPMPTTKVPPTDRHSVQQRIQPNDSRKYLAEPKIPRRRRISFRLAAARMARCVRLRARWHRVSADRCSPQC